MDANGQRFWMLGEVRHFAHTRQAVWDARCRVLRLASERTLQPVLPGAAAFALAQEALERTPRAVDALESVARWDAGANTVQVHTPGLGDVTRLALPEAPRDLCTGDDGVLYIALQGAVRLHDLRGRWDDVNVTLAGLQPWRLAPRPGGGVWVLERLAGGQPGRIAQLVGRPLPAQTPQPEDYDPGVFRPCPENGRPPTLSVVAAPDWGDGQPLAIAAAPDGAMAVLAWTDGEGRAAVRCWHAQTQQLGPPLALEGADHAYALCWVAEGQVALRVPGRPDAPAFDLATAAADGRVRPLGEVYPLAEDAIEAPFANGARQPPCYPVGDRAVEPLHALSLNHLARRGEAANFAGEGADFSAHVIDSGNATTVWHRLFAEASLPAHCGFVAWLAATDGPRPPAAEDLTAWQAHGFGRDIARLDPVLAAAQRPRAAWQREASELPGHPGLLGGERVPELRGLFSVLIQNSRARVRQLSGRYLWLRLVLHGDGRSGPEIAALRAWGGRFSYVDQYLPRLYREQLFGEAAAEPGELLASIDTDHAAALDAAGPPPAGLRARLLVEDLRPGAAAQVTVERPGQAWLLSDGTRAWRLAHRPHGIGVYRPAATPSDFLARLLASFESVLTPLEDRVAAAHALTDPQGVPDANLDWLAGWIGVAFDPALPQARRRDWLAAAPHLARRHGTRDGLRLALDLATGGAVRGGEIVVLEDFRLRRILATLLGVDLADETDPLLPGLAETGTSSGNSIVGDTLVLGDHERVELLALFREEVASAAEDQAVLSFLGRLAHRATVLVHREVQAQDFALIRRIAQLESPAHVDVRVVAASWPLLVGIASLVGVDTYLGPPRRPHPVRVQRSLLGVADFLVGPALLDARLSGAPPMGSAPPVADAAAPRDVRFGQSFILDGSGSRAAPGRSITEYRWRWLPPPEG